MVIIRLALVALLCSLCQSQVLQQTLNLYNNNLFVRMVNDGQNTQFFVTSPLGNGVSPNDAWLAIGFNNDPAMVSHFFVIKYFQVLLIEKKIIKLLEKHKCSYL